MSKVIIVEAEGYHVVLREILTELGYDIVQFPMTAFSVERVTAEGSAGKDVALIVVGRYSAYDYPASESVFISLNNLGYVFSLSGWSGTSSSSRHFTYLLGLVNNYTYNRNSTNTEIIPNSIFSEETLNNKTIVNSFDSIYTSEANICPGAQLLIRIPNTTSIKSFYLPSDTITLTKYKLKAPIFFMDFLYNLNLTAKAPVKNIIKDVLEYSIKSTKPPYLVKGSVTDEEGSALKREISVYSVNSKNLLNKGESSETTGDYSIGIYKDEFVFVVMNPIGLDRPDIHYNIKPTNNPEYI